MTVGDFLGVYGEGSILPLTQTRIKNALLSTNIKNVRDLLAFGSEAIADVDKIRKVAADGLPRVVAASGLQWQPRPGVAEWVQLYHRFGDMPVAALRAKLDYREWSALRSVETVRELLVMEESAVAALLTHQDPYSVRRSAREIITQIMTLAAAFEREKAIRRGR